MYEIVSNHPLSYQRKGFIGKETVFYLPFYDDDHQDGIWLKQWPQDKVIGVFIKKADTKGELAGIGL